MAAELDGGDDHAGGACDDVIAEALERDGRSDLLRDGHLPQVGEALRVVAHARRQDQIRRDERRARADEREKRLEHARAALEDVDEVDPPGAGRILATLHVDERRHRVRAVGQEQEVARRSEVEDDEGEHGEADHDAREPGG